MKSNFEWGDPTPLRGLAGMSPFGDIPRALRERPGAWARVAIYPSPNTARAVASDITHGRRHAFGRGFQAASRTLPDGTGAVFVRFLGDPPTEGA
jgi:hypothetical protein